MNNRKKLVHTKEFFDVCSVENWRTSHNISNREREREKKPTGNFHWIRVLKPTERGRSSPLHVNSIFNNNLMYISYTYNYMYFCVQLFPCAEIIFSIKSFSIANIASMTTSTLHKKWKKAKKRSAQNSRAF